MINKKHQLYVSQVNDINLFIYPGEDEKTKTIKYYIDLKYGDVLINTSIASYYKDYSVMLHIKTNKLVYVNNIRLTKNFFIGKLKKDL